MIIVGVGDIMPGGLLSETNRSCVSNDVKRILLQGDIRVGTLECALGNSPNYDLDKVADRGNVIYAKENDIKRLKELHIDIVSLANNHFFDLGVDGARRTIEILDREGIMHCGAGDNIKDACKPVVIEQNGKSYAFLGFCDTEYHHVYWCTYATEDQPGVNPMIEAHVVSVIQSAKKKYDYVIVLAHWGTENTFFPNLSTYKIACKMLKAGASLILGSHPHQIQPVVNTKLGCIAYSMGNFLFPERLIAPPKVTYYPDNPLDYDTLPVTDGYPLVDRITLKTLPFLARVGMIVVAELKDGLIRYHYKLSYLGKNNVLGLLDDKNNVLLEKKIHTIAIPLRFNMYSAFLLCKRSIGYINRKIIRK